MAENLTVARACSDADFLSSLKNASSSSVASERLLEVLKDLLDEYGQNFVKALGEKFRFDVIPEIYSEFVKLREMHEKVMEISVVSARELDEASLNAIKQKVTDKYGCSVILKTIIDPSIMGGAVLKIGDEVIDASVKSYLKGMASALK
ncbi:ATP synthase F1 subunit delta [Succinatimonas hippei]|uniref:ATP synthase F1 subunit delta n=1 Tax=Succinatimonas hippei TaxID=626938 RepID=UPI00255CDE4D|nr:ATP synthase F1 subunit delta [Succinatimonas hippei]